mgnify:CR=1 FL=1
MTQMIEPAGAPWSLARDNVLYVSSDEGKSWQKLRKMDPVAPATELTELQISRAKTVRDTVCASEELDGQMLESVQGTYDLLQGGEGTVTEKMWFEPETKWVPKSSMQVSMSGSEMKTVQLNEKTPELVLPDPQ